MREILVQTIEGGKRIPAHIVCGLAIHKTVVRNGLDGGRWIVSHINTGLVVEGAFRTRRDAWDFALRASALADWNEIHDRADVAPEVRPALQMLRADYEFA